MEDLGKVFAKFSSLKSYSSFRYSSIDTVSLGAMEVKQLGLPKGVYKAEVFDIDVLCSSNVTNNCRGKELKSYGDRIAVVNGTFNIPYGLDVANVVGLSAILDSSLPWLDYRYVVIDISSWGIKNKKTRYIKSLRFYFINLEGKYGLTGNPLKGGVDELLSRGIELVMGVHRTNILKESRVLSFYNICADDIIKDSVMVTYGVYHDGSAYSVYCKSKGVYEDISVLGKTFIDGYVLISRSLGKDSFGLNITYCKGVVVAVEVVSLDNVYSGNNN